MLNTPTTPVAATKATPATHQGLAILPLKPGQDVPSTPGVYAVEVSPALAQDWLNRYADPKKRSIRPLRVADYAAEMSSGNWLWGTAAITFVTNGSVYLDNGHHRLSGVVRAGVSVWMLVITGAAPDVRSVTDIGLNRSGADNIKMWGGTSYTTGIAAGVKMAIIYDQTVGTNRVWRGPSTFHLPTKREIVERWKLEPALWLDVMAAVQAGMKSIPAGIPPKAITTAVYLMERKHPGDGVAFINRLATMALPDLTNVLITAARTRPSGSGTQLEFDRWVVEVLIRAFNADHAGGRRWTRPQRTGSPAFTLSRVK